MNIDLERSLKDRIKAIAKAENRVFNDVWKSLALERFLVRLARSNKLDRFIFKGGFLLSKYLNLGRETADLDFSLRATDGSTESIKAVIQEILSLPNDDGFSFVDIAVQEMSHQHMEYPGFEVALLACLGNTKTQIRIDLGIGDHVVPETRSLGLLSLNKKPLFESAISIQVYPLSYIFAEKLEAVVSRGGTNSRMKDFYDLVTLARFSEFDVEANAEVVHTVFAHRRTLLPKRLIYDNQATETLSRSWKRFVGTLEGEFRRSMPTEFSQVVETIDQIPGSL
jgi:predicted nucleotidyltransferase component of viral defense system